MGISGAGHRPIASHIRHDTNARIMHRRGLSPGPYCTNGRRSNSMLCLRVEILSIRTFGSTASLSRKYVPSFGLALRGVHRRTRNDDRPTDPRQLRGSRRTAGDRSRMVDSRDMSNELASRTRSDLRQVPARVIPMAVVTSNTTSTDCVGRHINVTSAACTTHDRDGWSTPPPGPKRPVTDRDAACRGSLYGRSVSTKGNPSVR